MSFRHGLRPQRVSRSYRHGPCPGSRERETIAFLAAKRGQGVAIGTLIGSNITDPLLSIGFASMVHPLALTEASFALTAYIIIPATFVGTGVAVLMMRSQYEFKRWKAWY